MTTPESFLWVYDDRDRHLALVRGLNVRTVLESAHLADRARWSVTGKGYVIAGDDVADLTAMADHTGTPYRVKRVNS